MTRLDHNRAVAQLAQKPGARRVARSPTWRCGATTRRRCIPTCSTPRCAASAAWDVVGDEAWVAEEYIPRVGKRGAEIIEARGASSAASAANAAIDHVRDWVLGTPTATGSRWPCRPTAPTASRRGSSRRSPCARAAASGRSSKGLDVPDFSRERIDTTVDELARSATPCRSSVSSSDPAARAAPQRRRVDVRASRGPTSRTLPVLGQARASRGTGSSA